MDLRGLGVDGLEFVPFGSTVLLKGDQEDIESMLLALIEDGTARNQGIISANFEYPAKEGRKRFYRSDCPTEFPMGSHLIHYHRNGNGDDFDNFRDGTFRTEQHTSEFESLAPLLKVAEEHVPDETTARYICHSLTSLIEDPKFNRDSLIQAVILLTAHASVENGVCFFTLETGSADPQLEHMLDRQVEYTVQLGEGGEVIGPNSSDGLF